MLPRVSSLIPPCEPARLQALQPYRSLRVAPDAVFSALADLVSRLFDVPLVLLTLVDEEHTSIKASYGVTQHTIPRQQSLCALTILQDAILIVEDLDQEPATLLDFAFVRSLHMRFYAGYPLPTSTGYNIGALCLLDSHPRTLSSPEQHRLQLLARLTSQLLELRLHLQQRQPVPSPDWTSLYDGLYTALLQLDESDAQLRHVHTAGWAASLYQHKIQQRADTIVYTLQRQITALQARLLS
ncbi:GAF domain-containing protein [Hymenobacter profundi]|uniref:GAF domain-containing protein n=1 Tax=Hymenobacter profundi TaxID=1982110 RepID=UPI0031B881C3